MMKNPGILLVYLSLMRLIMANTTVTSGFYGSSVFQTRSTWRCYLTDVFQGAISPAECLAMCMEAAEKESSFCSAAGLANSSKSCSACLGCDGTVFTINRPYPPNVTILPKTDYKQFLKYPDFDIDMYKGKLRIKAMSHLTVYH